MKRCVGAAGPGIWILIGLLVMLPAGPVRTVDAETGQETVEIRGERPPGGIWPNAELRERGFDVPDIPRNENAAWVYIEAANRYLDLPEELNNAFGYVSGKAWLDNQPELRDWLTSKENREALDLARKASRMERCQMPYFGDPDGSALAVLLPSLRHYRTLAKIAVADGRRLAAQKDYRGAMDDFTIVLRLGHHVSQGITLIESLVGLACWNIASTATRDMVLRNDFSREELAAICEEWKKLKPLVPTVRRGFEYERLFGPLLVDEVVSRPTQLLRNLNELRSNGLSSGYVKSKDGWDRLEARIGRVFLPDRTIKRHMLEYYDPLVETVHVPYYDPRVRDFEEEKAILSIPQWDVLSRFLLPSLSRARLLGARLQTDTQATTLVLALRRHARENQGKYPATLADLSIELEPDDLIDPFSGVEFKYTRTADGWTLYSVGSDGTDNGGKSGERWDTADTDMVYVFPPEPLEPFEE
ncbi:MAG: hypothetical protein V2A79_19780 [Planctomycetota bacterium]